MKELAKVIPYAKKYWDQIILAVSAGVVFSATELATAMIVKPIFDDVFINKNGTNKLTFSLYIVGIFLVRGAASYLNKYNLRMVSEYIGADLRLQLQKKFMDLNMTYHSKNPSGTLMSKTLNDVYFIQEGMTRVSSILTDPLSIIAMFGYILYLNWKFTIMIFVVAPLIAVVLKQIARSARKYGHKQQETLERTTTIFKETFDGVRIIHSFNLEKISALRLLQSITEYLHFRKLVVRREEAASPITDFIGAVTVACVLFYMATLVINGKFTTGAFLSYMTALAIMQRPVKNIQDTLVRSQVMVAAFNRLSQVFENQSYVPTIANPKNFPPSFQTLEFKNVSFQYQADVPVLKSLNLKIKRGEVVALVGESGSGKSTIVNLLERFYEPSHGEICIDGINIGQIDLKQLRDNIALVTQDVFLFDDSIRANIRYGHPEKETISVEKATEMANAFDFISRTKDRFETTVGDRGARFSGGEKQRISIARAIYKNAPILILDEATSALDSQSEKEVQKGLEELLKGRTALVIAHRLSTVINADRILVLKDGEVVESGTHNELLERKGAYYNFYQLQSFA